MSMLKKVTLVLTMLMLAACVSEPIDKRFKGAGDFDSVEAAKTRVSLGLTYLKNGNFSQAKFNLDKALEFAPRSGEANYAMAFYYQQVDEVERAETYYQSAINYSRNDPDVLNSYGAFLCKQGQFEKSKSYFLRAVDDKSYISAAEAYENLAICLQSQNKIDEAIGYFNNALSHQPTRATSLLYLAQLYTERGQWEDAKRALWKYERNASVSADSLWLSFQIAQGQNDLRASLQYAELLRRLYPDYKNTQKALAQLGKFQPDMTVTQKSRVSQDNKANMVTEPASNIDATEIAGNANAKQSKILKPALPLANNTVVSKNDTETQAVMTSDEKEGSMAERLQSTNVETSINQASVPPDIAKKVELEDNPQTEISAQLSPFHIVKPTENLYRISVKYNVKIDKLLEWNNLTDASSIRIGTKLWIRDPDLNE